MVRNGVVLVSVRACPAPVENQGLPGAAVDPARQALPPRITCCCSLSCSLSRTIRLPNQPWPPSSALLHPFSLVPPPSVSQWANCDSGAFVSQRQGWGWGERGRNNLPGSGHLRASGGRSAGALGGVQQGEGRKSRAQGTAHAAGAQNSAGGLAERLADLRCDADPTLLFPLCIATPPLGPHP